jgi:signal transduction histidine kinase
LQKVLLANETFDICVMQEKFKKSLYVIGIWLIPVVFILIEAAIFLGKANWKSDYLAYSITFWILRAALAPLIVFYTLKFWVDHKKWLRLFLLHVGGFVLFSCLFWAAGYLILHNILHRSEFFGVGRTATNIGIFGMIVDNSISTNSIVYVSTVAFCYAWEFFKQNMIINKRAMELEKSLLTSKLELLKGQLNTHFLFNTLHTISSLVVRGQNEEANKMLVRLSELLRFALKEKNNQLIPLNREMELLQLYLDIQQTRFQDRLQVNVNVATFDEATLVPSMLLQPLVENALKYGIEPYTDNGLVEIDIHARNGSLCISITDNGKKDFKEINFNSGIGLANTKERLQNLYPGQHKFSVSPNNDQGVRVDIEILNQKTANAAIESDHS